MKYLLLIFTFLFGNPNPPVKSVVIPVVQQVSTTTIKIVTTPKKQTAPQIKVTTKTVAPVEQLVVVATAVPVVPQIITQEIKQNIVVATSTPCVQNPILRNENTYSTTSYETITNLVIKSTYSTGCKIDPNTNWSFNLQPLNPVNYSDAVVDKGTLNPQDTGWTVHFAPWEISTDGLTATTYSYPIQLRGEAQITHTVGINTRIYEVNQ